MEMKLTTESRDALITAIETQLDTRDKRFMFLKMEFKPIVPLINIEGSSHSAACNIYYEFEKRQMLSSLMEVMNSKLDCNLYLEDKQ